MKLNVRICDIQIEVFYIVFMICFLSVLCLWGMGNPNSQVRYYVLLACIFFAGKNWILRKKERYVYGKELLLVIPLGILFYCISVMRAMEVHHVIVFRTYVQIALLILPAIYAFFLINTLKISSIVKIMEFTLLCTIIAYFTEGSRDFFNMSNWTEISILHSRSFTESNICSEIFFNLFLFFNFYNNALGENINHINISLCYKLSFLFTLLSFKRLAMLVAILIVILNKFVDWKGQLPKHLATGIALFFSGATVLYTKFMKGEILQGFDVYNFTTGRNYILSLWKQNNYMSYGYGSSMELIGRYLEMDLVQIYMELNIIALFAFAYVFFKISKSNIYSLMIMVYAFFNMLTASSLPGSLSWVIAFLTIVTISSTKCEDEHILIVMRKTKLRRLFSKRYKLKFKGL